MSDPLRVVHVVLSLDVGGLERIVLDLIREGGRLGQDVAVACLERPGVLACRAESLGARVVCLHKPKGLRPGVVGRLRTALRGLRPDVVHTHQVGALFYAGPAARGAGRPLVVHTEHGKHYAGRPRRRLLGRLAARHAARFFCVSEDIAAAAFRYRIVPRDRLRVVSNGIDTGRYAGPGNGDSVRRSLRIPNDAPVIGTLGRLSEVKRQDLLLRGFARLRGLVPGAHLLLVGDGPLAGELRALADVLKLGDRIHFAGYQPEPEHYLHAMNVFALTSRSEGMPLSVLEAWAAGVPVVAPRVGGLPELIEDGRTGLLFDFGDEASMVSALGGLLADPGRAHLMAEAGRRRVEAEFSVSRMADDYHHHYLELLARERVSDGCVSSS